MRLAGALFPNIQRGERGARGQGEGIVNTCSKIQIQLQKNTNTDTNKDTNADTNAHENADRSIDANMD